jgi:hypothetical protein
MACLCCCVSSDELEEGKDKYGQFTNYFQTPLKDACYADCGCCLASIIFVSQIMFMSELSKLFIPSNTSLAPLAPLNTPLLPINKNKSAPAPCTKSASPR